MRGKLEIQYEIMGDENKNEFGKYLPSFDKLIEEAPNSEMKKEWEKCRELFNYCKDNEVLSGFSFRTVYMVKLGCGHYSIYQHGMPKEWSVSECEEDLFEWIRKMDFHSKDKCAKCRGF